VSKINMNTFGNIAGQIVANGYDPVPVFRNRKNPSVPKDFPNYRFTPADAFGAYKHDGVGLLTRNTPAADIDVREPSVQAEIERLAIAMLGAAPKRIGQAPKCALLYRLEGEPFAKIQTHGFRFPADAPPEPGKKLKAHKVEFLADGEQLVAYNIHQDTGKPYTWNGTGDPLTVPVAALAPITREKAQGFIDECEEILAAHGTRISKLQEADSDRPRQSNEKLLADDPARLRKALAFIKNEDMEYDDWIDMGHAIKGALGEAGAEDFAQWSAQSEKNDAQVTAAKWQSFEPTGIGAGSIVHWAKAKGFTGGDDLVPFDLGPVDESWLDTAPPSVIYLVEPILAARVTSLLVAEGGVGKTSFAMRMAICVAGGRSFFGMPVRQGKVIYIGREDSRDSMHRRIHWIIQREKAKMTKENRAHEISQFIADVKRNLWARSTVGKEFHLIRTVKGEVLQNTARIERLIEKMGDSPALIILDPLIRLHGSNENDNNVGTALIDAGELMAESTGASVVFAHHTGKGKEEDAGAYAGRGSSGLVDGARNSIRLMTVTAEALQWPNVSPDQVAAGDVVRLIHNKINDGPKAKPFYLLRDKLDFDRFEPATHREGNAVAMDEKLVGALFEWFCRRNRQGFVPALCNEKDHLRDMFKPYEVGKDKGKGVIARARSGEQPALIESSETAPHSAVRLLVFRDGFTKPM
jgi:RecA-family ATPase